MNWWSDALFDTCSLITVDKMLLDDPDLCRFFPAPRTIDACIWKDNLRPEHAARILPMIRLEEPPPIDIALASTSSLPAALSAPDRMIYATALHKRLAVVTGDKDLAKAIQRATLPVGNVALILKRLVETRELTPVDCDRILSALDARRDAIIPRPQTWERLREYVFP